MPTIAKRTTRRAARHGVATLEFVMALPLLFVLMICILWEGFWLIGQAEVLITARNDAWKKRFDNLADNPLSFPILPEHDLPVLPKYNDVPTTPTKRRARRSTSRPPSTASPAPKHRIRFSPDRGTYNAIKLKTPPNLKLMGKAALIGAFGNILDVAAAADDPLGLASKFASAKSEGEKINSQTESDKTNVGKGGSASEPGGGAGGGSTEGGKTPEEAQKDAEEDLRKQKQALKDRFKEIGAVVQSPTGKVAPGNGPWDDAIDDLIAAQADSKAKSEAAILATEEEDKKKKQEEAARARRKVELLQITVKRLETEANDIVEEAEALDMSRFELNFP